MTTNDTTFHVRLRKIEKDQWLEPVEGWRIVRRYYTCPTTSTMFYLFEKGRPINFVGEYALEFETLREIRDYIAEVRAEKAIAAKERSAGQQSL